MQENRKIGKYLVQAFLGQGGMGAVYRGYDESLDRWVAIKELKTDGMDRAKDIQRFCNEARIQATLHHPNIATLYEFFEEAGQPYIVMEYVDGHTLLERLKGGGRLAVGEILQIFHAVVLAINHLHNHDITHRDIKLNNIKLNSGGQVKLLDFGIARQRSGQRLTTTGKVSGTLDRLSPEQLQSGASDNRTDIWQLGVILYEMATGAPPFEAATTDELFVKIMRSPHLPPSVLNPAVPRQVEEVISCCLKKDPAQRYQSSQHLLNDVEKLIAPPKASYTRSATREIVIWVVQKVQKAIAPSQRAGLEESSSPSGRGRAALLAALALAALIAGLFWWLPFPANVWPVADGLVRTQLSCNESGVEVLRVVGGESLPIGVCGSDQLYVDALPGEMVTLQLKKNGITVPVEPFQVTDRRREFHLPTDPNIFMK